MVLHLNGKIQQVKVLLDTGCSITLINKRTIEKYGIKKEKHRNPRPIENYVGERSKEQGNIIPTPSYYSTDDTTRRPVLRYRLWIQKSIYSFPSAG